jgi:hypothetical protein
MDDPRPARPLVLHECTCQVLTKLNECRFGLSLYSVMNELHRHILPFFLIRSPWRRCTQVILPGSGCIGHQVTTVFFDISRHSVVCDPPKSKLNACVWIRLLLHTYAFYIWVLIHLANTDQQRYINRHEKRGYIAWLLTFKECHLHTKSLHPVQNDISFFSALQTKNSLRLVCSHLMNCIFRVNRGQWDYLH